MSDIINLLPDHVANQIAAGEVVQRPASVIKELMENSIDAGATKIQVIVKDAGKTLIQVIDNGCGMSATDARMCFERHATSKIQKAADLFDIQTMGFRGEAMASIVAIATVEMRTRKYGDELGTFIKMTGSEVEAQEPTSCPNGTNIMVKNLFYNVPARRKFLKSDSTELKEVTKEFYHVALAHPDVEMSLTHNGVEMLNLPIGNIFNRILGIVGKSYAKKLLPVESETSVARIKGYVGTPDCAKVNKNDADQYFFVNGRFMKHPVFCRAVQKAYDQLLPQGKNPAFFIYIDVDPATIDINIHPTKTEIKFENEQSIWPIMQATVREALGKIIVAPTIDFDNQPSIDIPVFNSADEVRPPQIHYSNDYNPFSNSKGRGISQTATFRSRMSGGNTDWEKLYSGFENTRQQTDDNIIDNLQNSKLEVPALADSQEQTVQSSMFENEKETACNGRFFQLKNKYILTNVKSGLMVIDQHRAHERILFEHLMVRRTDAGASQRLLYPERLDLNLKDTDLFRQMVPELEKLGFEVNDLGGNNFSFSAIPATFPESELKDWINSMLMLTGEEYMVIKDSMREGIVASMARYMAIGYGKQLSQEEMADINNRLFACKMPNFTPSGRPIVAILTMDEIEKLFR
ncbi:MAG: DNA mismatch repair endonuclease MutL [Salinivirgaceae bacterium]|nr:DNA mismatch repair endonuclease MutL [Salinivirgaceae bacterium]